MPIGFPARAAGAFKFMEWLCAFTLMITLVWLRLEILRRLSSFQCSRWM